MKVIVIKALILLFVAMLPASAVAQPSGPVLNAWVADGPAIVVEGDPAIQITGKLCFENGACMQACGTGICRSMMYTITPPVEMLWLPVIETDE